MASHAHSTPRMPPHVSDVGPAAGPPGSSARVEGGPKAESALHVPVEWLPLWQSAVDIHPDAGPAMRNAIDAGADPRQLRLIMLADQGQEVAPLFWFGPTWGACRVFNPTGEVSA